MAYDDAGELRGGEQLFEPADAFEIQVIGGLVKEQHVGRLSDLAGDGEAPLPAAGKGVCAHTGVGEAGASQGLADARGALQFIEVLALDDGGDHFVHGVTFGELGLLRHIADARFATEGDGAAIGLELACQDAQQSGFSGAVAADPAQALAFGNA